MGKGCVPSYRCARLPLPVGGMPPAAAGPAGRLSSTTLPNSHGHGPFLRVLLCPGCFCELILLGAEQSRGLVRLAKSLASLTRTAPYLAGELSNLIESGACTCTSQADRLHLHCTCACTCYARSLQCVHTDMPPGPRPKYLIGRLKDAEPEVSAWQSRSCQCCQP